MSSEFGEKLETTAKNYYLQTCGNCVFQSMIDKMLALKEELMFKYIKAQDRTNIYGLNKGEVEIIKAFNNKNIKPSYYIDKVETTLFSTFNDSSKKNVCDVIVDIGYIEEMYKISIEPSWLKHYVNSVSEMLDNGGRYIQLTTCFNGQLQELIDSLSEYFYPIRIVKVVFTIPYDNNHEEKFIGYFIVSFKRRECDAGKSLFYYGEVNCNEKITNISNVFVSRDQILQLTQLDRNLITSYYLRHNNISDVVRFILYKDQVPAYTINLIDCDHLNNYHYSYMIFIVARGYENDWIFCDETGLKELASNLKVKRLMVVNLHTGQPTNDIDEIKNDLNGMAIDFIPLHKYDGENIPFVTNGQTDLGSESIIYSTVSELSGQIIISDVQIQTEKRRRIIFSQTPSVIQSERIFSHSDSSNSSIFNVTPVLEYQKYIVLFVYAIIKESVNYNALLVGLGGGCLATALITEFPNIKLEAIDIDPVMIDIAKQYFDLKPNNRLTLSVCDGLEYFKQKKQHLLYDFIILDVNNQSNSQGICAPHPSFMENMALENLIKCLSLKGILLLNLSCRNKKMSDHIFSQIKQKFGELLYFTIEGEINKIIVASKTIASFCEYFTKEISKIPNDDQFISKYFKTNNTKQFIDNLYSRRSSI